MSLTRSEAESATPGAVTEPAARPYADPDVPVDEPANPAPLPAVPGLVMLVAAEDAQMCSDGTCW